MSSIGQMACENLNENMQITLLENSNDREQCGSGVRIVENMQRIECNNVLLLCGGRKYMKW